MNSKVATITKINEKDGFIVLQVERENEIIDDVEILHNNGIISKPIKDRGVFVLNVNKHYSIGLGFKDDNLDFGLSEGDIVIYSTDESGTVVSQIHLTNEGDIVIKNDRDFNITCAGLVFESSGNIIAKSDKDIAIESSGGTTVDGSKIELNGNSKSFVTYTELNTALQTMWGLVKAHSHASHGAASLTLTPASLDISASQTQTVKTGG